MKLGIGLLIHLFTLVIPLIIPQERTKIIFPEIEDKIEENNKLKTEIDDRNKIIANMSKEKEKLVDEIKNLNDKNFAELKTASLVVDGLKNKTKSSVAMINGLMYLNQETTRELLNQQVFYDENNETIYIGNKGNKITKEDLECNYSMLYNGKGYVSLDSIDGSTIKEPKVAGIEMTQRFIIEGSSFDNSYALFRLDGKYSSIEFDAGMLDNTSQYSISDAVIKLELDGTEKYKEKIRADIASKHYKFDVTGIKTLKINLSDSNAMFGFYNVIFNKSLFF